MDSTVLGCMHCVDTSYYTTNITTTAIRFVDRLLATCIPWLGHPVVMAQPLLILTRSWSDTVKGERGGVLMASALAHVYHRRTGSHMVVKLAHIFSRTWWLPPHLSHRH